MQTPDMQLEESPAARPGQARRPESFFLALTTHPVQEGEGTLFTAVAGGPRGPSP